MRLRDFIVILLLQLLLIPARVICESEYIRHWLILGSFQAKPEKQSLAFPYFENEAEMTAHGGLQTAGLKWMLYHSPDNFLDLKSGILKFKYTEASVAYTQVFIFSNQEQPAKLFVGSDDEIAIWCNGKKVWNNWIQRIHQFDQDVVSLNLKVGWNQLLFKIVNGALAWQLSARVEAENKIQIQAANPTLRPLNQREVSNLVVRKITPEIQKFTSNENQVRLGFNIFLFNEGIKALKNIQVEVGRQYRPMVQTEPIQEILGGEVQHYKLALSFAEIDSLLSPESPIQIHFKNEEIDLWQNFPILNYFQAIASIFSPWKSGDWTCSQANTNFALESTWVTPDVLKNLELKFQTTTGKIKGVLSVNNRRAATNFGETTGTFSLTTLARTGEAFKFQLLVPADSDFTKPDLNSLQFEILPDFPGINIYLKEIHLAKDIFNLQIPFSPQDEAQLFAALRNGRVRDVQEILRTLEENLKQATPLADSFQLHLISTAHLDPAWLWQSTETIESSHRLFQTAVELMQENRDYTFSHGQALSYWWIEQRDPALFNEIKKFIKRGQWEVIGGTWSEADFNLCSGESAARQFLYGKNYFKDRFDIEVKTGWMPDALGHPVTLPQILKKSGIETYTYFRPGHEEQFFYWRAPDGSSILGHRPPFWYDPPLTDDIWQGMWEEEQIFGIRNGLRFYGEDAQAGEPNRRDIKKIQQLNQFKAFPLVKMAKMADYYQQVQTERAEKIQSVTPFPVLDQEFSLLSPGCYTTLAKIKWNNRRAECLVPAAEIFSTLAMHFEHPYPVNEFTQIWNDVLFNQSHTILSGISAHPINTDAFRLYDKIFTRTNELIKSVLNALASNVNTLFSDTDVLPVVVFNPAAWPRTAPIELTIPLLQPKRQHIQIFDSEGHLVPVQILERVGNTVRFLLLAREVPEFGYRTYWLQQTSQAVIENKLSTQLQMENKFLSVEIDSKTGLIKKLLNKQLQHNFMKQGGGGFQIQNDNPPRDPAMELGLTGPIINLLKPVKLEVTEDGAIRKVIRVEYRYQRSVFVQKYILYHDLPQLEVQVTIDWQERNKMVKLAFPIELNQPRATFDIPFGTIVRERNGKEVPAQKWIDLSNSDCGISLLNDCKYGFEVKANLMRMSVLRAVESPDSSADRGYHGFSYALYPHKHSWQMAFTMREGYNFNTPLFYTFAEIHKGSHPPCSSFLKVDPDNVIVTALKKTENGDGWILRLNETSGQETMVQMTLPKPVQNIYETDIVEWSREKIAQRGYDIKLSMKPYEIKTLRIEF